MRIISLIPAATEILCALGAVDQIVGISHECDYPEEVKNIPKVTDTVINQNNSSLSIDQKVSDSLKNGQSIYTVDSKLFVSLKPDLIITQKLCEVCAITPTDIQVAIRDSGTNTELISLHPHSIKEILENILEIGKAVGREEQATVYSKQLTDRMNFIKNKTNKLEKPSVYCMEWLDPPYNAGHWVPEQVEIAGGVDQISTKNIDSVRLLWDKILEYNPEYLILMPCGFSIARTKRELNVLTKNQYWNRLKAVQNNRVYIVNGPAYFNCSGPRVIEGIELLAQIFHPELSASKNFTKKDIIKL